MIVLVAMAGCGGSGFSPQGEQPTPIVVEFPTPCPTVSVQAQTDAQGRYSFTVKVR